MRKPRDFDAELEALGDKTRDLKSRKGRRGLAAGPIDCRLERREGDGADIAVDDAKCADGHRAKRAVLTAGLRRRCFGKG